MELSILTLRSKHLREEEVRQTIQLEIIEQTTKEWEDRLLMTMMRMQETETTQTLDSRTIFIAIERLRLQNQVLPEIKHLIDLRHTLHFLSFLFSHLSFVFLIHYRLRKNDDAFSRDQTALKE